MFTPKEYDCYCRVCQTKFVYVSEFLGGTTIVLDGKAYLTMSCGKHTGPEIRAAYLNSLGGSR